MNKFIQIKSNVDGAFLKVTVMHGSFIPGDPQPRHASRTVTGKLSLSLGSAYKIWRGVARVSFTPASGYASRTNFQNWMASNNAEHHKIQLIDHFGVTYNAAFTNDLLPEAGVPVHDASGSFYLIPFEIESR